MSQDSSASKVTGYSLKNQWQQLFTTTSRSALEFTQFLIQWVAGALSQETKQLDCEVDYSPHLVPRLRMSGA